MFKKQKMGLQKWRLGLSIVCKTKAVNNASSVHLRKSSISLLMWMLTIQRKWLQTRRPENATCFPIFFSELEATF